ncbi:hypothetical protein M8C21_019358, partial [Ambrosia artemisiifolia]
VVVGYVEGMEDDVLVRVMETETTTDREDMAIGGKGLGKAGKQARADNIKGENRTERWSGELRWRDIQLQSINQMSELQEHPSSPPTTTTTLPPPSPSTQPPSAPPPPRFDPTRSIGIIKRKALIKNLAAVYHAECLAYCQELLELQRKCEEITIFRHSPYADVKVSTDLRKETMRPPKRNKKSR